MGYVACGDLRLKKLESEMMQRYRKVLKFYEGKPESGEDFNLARVSLARATLIKVHGNRA